jgi:hypothetical protein
MESASNLTISNSKRNENCAGVTLENVMLGDPKTICSEIGGGGGPWRDILEEMAGNLSGEFGAATSDVLDGLSDRKYHKADGMSRNGSNLTDELGNMRSDPICLELQENNQHEQFSEIEAALQNLTPADVEQRRARTFGGGATNYYAHRYNRGNSIASDGFDSPGNWQI